MAVIFKSPHPDVAIPSTPLTPFVFRHAQEMGAKQAIVDAASGRGYTYAELYEAVRKLAAGLHERGFRKGDVLASTLAQRIERRADDQPADFFVGRHVSRRARLRFSQAEAV